MTTRESLRRRAPRREPGPTPATARDSSQLDSALPSAGHRLGGFEITPAGPGVQARPSVGEPRDRHEVEADRIASAVTGAEPPARTNGDAFTDEDRALDSSAADGLDRLGQGEPLPSTLRQDFESRMGADFSDVRVHTDRTAGGAALALRARAFTVGSDIAFAPGAWSPASREGGWLLAHELTHVAQQRAGTAGHGSVAPARVQRGFFDDVWSGIQQVGSAIGGAFEAVGGAISSAFEWLGGRLEDAGRWLANLLRDLPARLVRFGEAIAQGLAGVVSFIPEAIGALISGGISGFGDWLWQQARAGAAWVHRMVTAVFDLVGGPELVEFVMHMFSHATPLTDTEIRAGKDVLGETAIHWGDVRVAEGGFLALVFALNGGRAFTSFHTINIPAEGDHSRTHLDIMVHELTHVYQYELVGSRYMGEAIHAQATIGYGYGGASGLATDRAAGRHFRDYNREQQAQIAQDYYQVHFIDGLPAPDYEPFIAELRAGQI